MRNFLVFYDATLHYAIHYTISGDEQIKKKTVSLYYTTLHYAIHYTIWETGKCNRDFTILNHTTLRHPLPLHYTVAGVGASPIPVVTHTLTRWRHGISKSARGSEPNGTSCHKTFVHKATRQR